MPRRAKSKSMGELPHTLWKKGLVRQGYRHSVSRSDKKLPSGAFFRPKQPAKDPARGIKYKKKTSKNAMPHKCNCGCSGK